MSESVKSYLKRIGRKGGKQRKKNLSAKRRTAIARKAAKSRWSKKRAKP
jgi:hypothetical protein